MALTTVTGRASVWSRGGGYPCHIRASCCSAPPQGEHLLRLVWPSHPSERAEEPAYRTCTL